LEATLLGAETGTAVATERSELEELRSRYESVLAAWEEGGVRTDETARELDERRAQYERGLSVMELALLVKGGATGNGELAEIRVSYRTSEDDYVEAERLHQETQTPYEEAVRAAERRYGADRMQGLMERLGMEEGVPIEHRLITRAIRNAQEKVEAHNFDIRKHLLEYDDVLNKQREVVYSRRRELLGRDDLREDVLELATGIAEDLVATHAEAEVASEEWDWKALDDAVFAQFNFRLQLPGSEHEGL